MKGLKVGAPVIVNVRLEGDTFNCEGTIVAVLDDGNVYQVKFDDEMMHENIKLEHVDCQFGEGLVKAAPQKEQIVTKSKEEAALASGAIKSFHQSNQPSQEQVVDK